MEAAVTDRLAANLPVSLALFEVQGLRALALLRGGDAADKLVTRTGAHLQAQADLAVYRLLDGQFGLLFDGTYDEVEQRCQELVSLPRGGTACVGIARLREEEDDPAVLHDRAEQALAQARRRGARSVVTLTHGGDPARHVGPDHAAALLSLLREGQIRIHYQPIVALQDRRVIAFEALARPQLSHDLAGPNTAFAVAERMGLSVDLDTLCRRSIFTDAPGLSMPMAARLHINLSADALGHSSLSARELHVQVRDAGIEPDRIVFELRQRPGQQLHDLSAELTALRHLGFGLCLDDVGNEVTGMLSLGLGFFTMVKISPRITAGLGHEDHADAFLDGICAYAARAGIEVVVAGVETSDQLELLRRYRIAGQRPIFGLQGYYLGEPSRHPGGDDDPHRTGRGGADAPTGPRVSPSGHVATGRPPLASRRNPRGFRSLRPR